MYGSIMMTVSPRTLRNATLWAMLSSLSMPLCAAPATPPDNREETDAAYTLASGDKLRVTVYGAPTLSGDLSVNSAGDIAMPLVGDVPATGRTSEMLASEIRAKLSSGYVLDPRISVEILTYRPYYILGEVSKPGEFPFAQNLTVQQAVAAAGGYTYRASRHRAFVRRAGGPEISEKLGEKPVYVRPGDTIRIGERYF
jgi:polysaccharide export outer membrane protein